MQQKVNIHKKRNYSVDMLKVLSMYFVMGLHVLLKGGILEGGNFNNYKIEAAGLLELLMIVAVNVFAMVSGYLGVYSKFKLRRFMELWLQVLFYTIVCLVCYIIFTHKLPNVGDILKSVFPLMEQHYWYFSSYAIVYLFSPMINKGLLSLSKSRLKQVIFFLLLIACIGGNINMNNFGLLGGYSPLWLAILWVIGGYIRLYGVGGRKYLHLGMYLLFVILNLALSNIISILKYYLTGNPQKFNLSLVIRYNNPLVVIASIALVVFILKIRINNKGVQRVLLFASPLSFGAYLLQTNIFVYQTLNYPWLVKQNIIVMVLGILLLALLWFVAGIITDYIRKIIFSKIGIDSLLKSIANRYDG
ncbi:acyltransferase [Limosilactobacillus fermentum]